MIYYPSRPIRVLNLEKIRKQSTWIFQVKFNGHHMVVSTHQPHHTHSRHGTPLNSADGTDFSTECAQLFGLDCIIDGELVGPAQTGNKKDYFFVVWDIPVLNGVDQTKLTYQDRFLSRPFKTGEEQMGRLRLSNKIWLAKSYSMLHLNAVVSQLSGKMHEGVVAKDPNKTLDWSRLSQLECRSQLKWRL